MESNKEKINQLPILEVLSKLGYNEGSSYILQGNNIRMKDNGKVTDGWIGSIEDNYLWCKSGLKPGRFEGDIIGIIKGALGIEVADAIKFAEDEFKLEKSTYIARRKNNGLEMKIKWDSLPLLEDIQIQYLKDRGIEYNEHIKINSRREENKIVIPIQTSNFSIKALQKREAREVEKKWRYQIEKGPDGDGDGIFIYLPNKEKKVIFVVEGMTDFLTIASFGVNVIGLVSALTGIQYLKDFHKNYELVYISDNDDSGAESVRKLEDNGVKFGHYKIDIDGIKDINDYWLYSRDELGLSSLEFLKVIYNGIERPKSNIELALDKAIRNRDNVGWLTGEKTFDWATGGIVPGTTMLINGAPGQGKTTIAMWLLFIMLKAGKKVIFFSLETDSGKMLAQILGFHFGKNWRKEIYPNIEKYLLEYGINNLDNLLLYDDVDNLTAMREIIIEEKADVVFIDYAQIMGGLEGVELKQKMNQYGKEVQRIAIETYTAMVSLSQVNKSDEKIPVIQRTPMESQALKATSDTMINVGIYNGKHSIAFIKCKNGDDSAWNTEHDSVWNKDTGAITIFRDFSTMDSGGSPL